MLVEERLHSLRLPGFSVACSRRFYTLVMASITIDAGFPKPLNSLIFSTILQLRQDSGSSATPWDAEILVKPLAVWVTKRAHLPGFSFFFFFQPKRINQVEPQ